MGFASAWLDERALFPEFIKEAPDPGTGIIVVIPAYNESGITSVLNSLASCRRPTCSIEVIVVVNAPSQAAPDILKANTDCFESVESWKKQNKNCFFRLSAINIVNPPFERWGVGYARKTGMDEAVRRFNRIDKPDGVIVNLDADCSVADNYFTSINSELLKRPEHSACSIYFEHPLSGADYPGRNYSSITWYELHLRYYLHGIKYAGHPFAFHTIGSALAVKAITYIKAGGMNRRQAGEDFYFIQKLIPSGGYFSLNSTVVYPSPRASFRVPFGTGATISKLLHEKSGMLLTYNVQAFSDLGDFFRRTDLFSSMINDKAVEVYTDLPDSVKSFINFIEFESKIKEIKDNTAGIESFRKRFFSWFNIFMIVKFMNQAHRQIFVKMPVNEAASELLRLTGTIHDSKDPVSLLKIYRKIEKDC